MFNLENYKNDSGMSFKNEAWMSFLPTDSQILSTLFIKYLQEIFLSSNINRPILVNYPLTPREDLSPDNLCYYQTSGPGYQPHFDIFYQNKIYNCISGKDNFFYASILLLFIMKNNNNSQSKQIPIDQFLNMIINF